MVNLLITLLQNACVIIVFCYVLTRTRFFNEILERRFTRENKLWLILCCGLFSIYGTVGGMEILGAFANIRDLGPAIAGLLAGPLVGVGAGLIGALHRLFLGGFTAVPCTISTILAGFLAGLVFLAGKKRVPSLWVASGFAGAMEILHMGFVLLISKPYEEALALVKTVALPMIFANALGMAAFFFITKNLISELKTRSEKNLIEGELRGAREIQMSIVPHIYPPFPDIENIDLHAKLVPAKEVGGDLYDYYLLDENKNQLFFMVGDVSDKGVPASLFMIITMTLFKANTRAGEELGQIVERINNQLAADNKSNMFVTLFCAVLNIETGEMRYVNAGHNPPLLIRKDRNPEFIPTTGDLVLGCMPDMAYTAKTLNLNPSDTLFLYTDGVTEAFNSEQELFSETRLLDIARKTRNLSAKDGIDDAYDAIWQFTNGAAQSDDITMLMLRY